MRGEYSPPLLRVCRKWLRLGDLRVILQLGLHSLLLRQGLDFTRFILSNR